MPQEVRIFELASLMDAIKAESPNTDDSRVRDAAQFAYEWLLLHISIDQTPASEILSAGVRQGLNYLRRETRLARKHHTLDETKDKLPVNDGGSNSFERQNALETLLLLLPLNVRPIVEAHYIEGMKYEELVEQFGKSADALERQVLRELDKLRRKIPMIEWETWGGGGQRKPPKRPRKHQPRK